MSNEANDEGHLRKYLLGELEEADQQALEERLMTDGELFDLLHVAEDELIEDYFDGTLSADERGRFDSFFLSTPERRRKLSFAMALRRYVTMGAALPEPSAARPSHEGVAPNSALAGHRTGLWKQVASSPYLKLGAAAVLVIVVGAGIWRSVFPPSDVSEGIAVLREAYRNQRPTEARITQWSYAPPPPVTRGPGEGKFDYVTRDRAAALIREDAADGRKAGAVHDLGRLYLAEHDYKKAIEQFEKALKLDEKNALLYSDLGAAYFERATATPGPPNVGDLGKSLEQSKRAIEIDDSLLAAYFNRALCLQRMNALAPAKQAWEDYLKRDANSEWSKEAARNLRLLQGEKISNRTPQEVLSDFMGAYRQTDKARAWRIQSQTKEMITGTMVPFQLARSFLAADSPDQARDRNEILQALSFAGDLEKENSDDPFFAEMAGYYRRVGARNVPALKKAQEDLLDGYHLCLQGRYGDASRFFERAQRLFRQAGNKWESRVVDYWRAYCLSQQGELRLSSDLLRNLAVYCQNFNYHWLQAQSYCWLANNSALAGEYSTGAEQDKMALSLALATGDLYNTQKTSSQIAEDHKFLGRLSDALEHNRQSLPSADDYFVSYRQFWRSLFSITDTLFALRMYAAAEGYQQQALDLALNHFSDPALMHDTYMRLGQIYGGQGDYAAAARALELSLKMLQPIENDPIGKKLFGLSMLHMGNIKRQTANYNAALECYRRAAQQFDASEFGLYNYDTHKGILLCHLLNKDDRAIQQELPVVLNLFEQNRQRIKEEANRNHFFDAEQSVYDLAIDYEYGRANKEQSFNYAESSRARSLQDAMIGGATANNDSTSPDMLLTSVSQPLSLAQIQEGLPEGLRLVEYAVLQNRLLIWVVTRSSFEIIEQPVSMASLKELTNEYLNALIGDDQDSIEREKELAAELHDCLFAPIEALLNKSDEIALVPDKFLFTIPFAALLSRQAGRRVVIDYTLLYSPSATVMAICSDVARMKQGKKEAERLLSVGDPVFNRQHHQGLSDLPSAAVEAREIASVYRTRAVFIRESALRELVEPELARADVIHFAAHYLTDDLMPARSRLLLTARPRSDPNAASDDLSLQEIQTMRLRTARLAILSACQSGVERFYSGEGLIGLSRAFLAAGIPLVVASQWAVETNSTADLMVDFHKLRKVQSLPTTRALRQAQLNMLNNNEDEGYRRPFYWAAFFAIGGHASY